MHWKCHTARINASWYGQRKHGFSTDEIWEFQFAGSKWCWELMSWRIFVFNIAKQNAKIQIARKYETTIAITDNRQILGKRTQLCRRGKIEIADYFFPRNGYIRLRKRRACKLTIQRCKKRCLRFFRKNYQVCKEKSISLVEITIKVTNIRLRIIVITREFA